MKRAALLVAVPWVALLGACASSHGLHPEAVTADPASLQAARSLEGGGNTAWPATDWWTTLGDPQLDALIQEALAHSPNIKIAEARIRKAESLAKLAHADLSPDINGTGDISRQRLSENYIYPPPFGGQWYTFSEAKLNFSYEFDFWGKNSAAYESALGGVKAAEVDAYAARLMLATGVAHAYIQLAQAYEQQDVAQALLEQRTHTLDLTRQRADAGLDSALDLKQAETFIPASRQQLAAIDENIALARNQLAALLGAGPDRGLDIPRPAPLKAAAPALPSTLPAELLGRRPDVVAQRWRVEAAAQDIKVARAGFYPNINLAAFAGLQSLGLSQFFNGSSAIAGLGPAITLPIYAGGKLRANLAGRDADYDVAAEQYNQTLTDALRDVADRLTTLRSAQEQRAHLDEAVATAREAYALSESRYQSGIDNYLQVLATQAQLLSQLSLVADVRARELDASVDLARALGGGYVPPVPAPSANGQ